MLTKEVATKVLKECLATGADFAEIFYEVKKTNTIAMVSKMIKNSDTSVITGVGIRILKDLQEALVILKSNIDAPIGSSEIPCCNSVPYPNNLRMKM